MFRSRTRGAGRHGTPSARSSRSRYSAGPGRRRFRGSSIHPSKFIRKADAVAPEAPFVPVHSFADFDIPLELKANIARKGFTEPSPIQDSAIPHVLKKHDIVGIANTGTGKTAAFLIPLIAEALNTRNFQALIMVPTRELALQIEEEFRAFARGMRLYSSVFVGGTSVGRDISRLRYHSHFIIGTPGRLKDLIERGALFLGDTSVLVLDEADRMLDMGFINDMRSIVAEVPRNRHTLFFSATMNQEIESLVGEFLSNPIKISVKKTETASSVNQDVVRVKRGESKFETLVGILSSPGFTKVLIFGATKHGVERLAEELKARGIKAESIHGNKTHGKRQQALKLFKNHHVDVLVATDVAARGLDISGVSHVINYDQPATYDDYVHRIGRTGRGGKTGEALTFVDG